MQWNIFCYRVKSGCESKLPQWVADELRVHTFIKYSYNRTSSGNRKTILSVLQKFSGEKFVKWCNTAGNQTTRQYINVSPKIMATEKEREQRNATSRRRIHLSRSMNVLSMIFLWTFFISRTPLHCLPYPL